MASDKYKAFTNYMHNELEISKQDIRDWTKEAVYEVAEKYIQDNFSEEKLQTNVMRLVRDRHSSLWRDDKSLESTIKDMVVKELLKNIQLDVQIGQKPKDEA